MKSQARLQLSMLLSRRSLGLVQVPDLFEQRLHSILPVFTADLGTKVSAYDDIQLVVLPSYVMSECRIDKHHGDCP